MAYYDGTSGAMVFETAIAGTHSSGKSTLIDSLRNPILTETCELEEPYGVSMVEVQVETYDPDDEGVRYMPLVTVSEASRHLANQAGDPTMLTENYTSGVQRQVDMMALAYPQRARFIMSEVFRQMRDLGSTAGRLANIGAILSDRGPLDGAVYAETRLPDEGHAMWHDFPLRRHMEFQALSRLDQVFITNPHEVPFTDDGVRPDGVELRNNIHECIVEMYSKVATNACCMLKGTPEERRAQVIGTLCNMVSVDHIALMPWSRQLPSYLS